MRRGRFTEPLKINVGEIQLVERKGRDFEAVVFNIHLCSYANKRKIGALNCTEAMST